MSAVSTGTVDCYSSFGAQQGTPQHIRVKRHPFDYAFALTDYKLQGKTLPKLILNVCRRSRLPFMLLPAFYVLVSRVRTMDGLRLLTVENAALNSVSALTPDEYLHAWHLGYDANGTWSDTQCATAFRAFVEARAARIQAERDARRAQRRAATRSTMPTTPSTQRVAPPSTPQQKARAAVENTPQRTRSGRTIYCTACGGAGHTMRSKSCPMYSV